MGFEQEWPPRQEGLFCLIEEKRAGKFLAHNLSGSNQKFNSFNCIYSSKNFRLFYKQSSKSGLEISISKKYFRLAVKRNKIKRQVKEIFRSLNIVIPSDGVVIFSVFRPFGELSYEKALLEVDEAVKSLSGDLRLK